MLVIGILSVPTLIFAATPLSQYKQFGSVAALAETCLKSTEIPERINTALENSGLDQAMIGTIVTAYNEGYHNAILNHQLWIAESETWDDAPYKCNNEEDVKLIAKFEKEITFALDGNRGSVSKRRENIINPFGDIRWNDDIIEVIKKINKKDNDTNSELIVQIGYSSKPFNISNITTLHDIKRELSKIITQLENEETFSEYNDGNTKSLVLVPAIGMNIEIKSTPIIISGEPFSLIISFKSSLGYMEKHKNSLVSIDGNKGSYYLPFYIKEVKLKAHEYRYKIPVDIRNKIKEMIYSKYKDMLFEGCKTDRGEVLCKDQFEDKLGKTKLLIVDRGNYFTINYENHFTENELDEIHKNHLRMLRKKKHENHQDVSGDL